MQLEVPKHAAATKNHLSTSAEVLKHIDHPIAVKIMKYRTLENALLVSGYLGCCDPLTVIYCQLDLDPTEAERQRAVGWAHTDLLRLEHNPLRPDLLGPPQPPRPRQGTHSGKQLRALSDGCLRR